MRFIYIVLLLLSLPLFAQEWQQQRIDASSNPDEWITKTNQWISQYDEGREFEKLALAYALQSEAYRYSGNETKLIETVKEGLRFAKLADSEVASALLRINQTWYQLQRVNYSKLTPVSFMLLKTPKHRAMKTYLLKRRYFTLKSCNMPETLPKLWKF